MSVQYVNGNFPTEHPRFAEQTTAKIATRRGARTAAAKAVIALLAERWPQCFSVYEKRRKPLKLGIHIEILAALGDAVTPSELSVALGIYCRNGVYLCRCSEGAPRIGLNGNCTGHVTAEEAEHAAARLGGRAVKRPVSAGNNVLSKTAHCAVLPPSVEGIAARPKRLSLDDLRAAAAARRQQESEAMHSLPKAVS
jgi:sRNA-binding protein